MATGVYTLGKVGLDGVLSKVDLINQSYTFADNPTAVNIPVLGPTADGIALATSNYIDNPNLDNTANLAKAYLGATLATTGTAKLSGSMVDSPKLSDLRLEYDKSGTTFGSLGLGEFNIVNKNGNVSTGDGRVHVTYVGVWQRFLRNPAN